MNFLQGHLSVLQCLQRQDDPLLTPREALCIVSVCVTEVGKHSNELIE